MFSSFLSSPSFHQCFSFSLCSTPPHFSLALSKWAECACCTLFEAWSGGPRPGLGAECVCQLLFSFRSRNGWACVSSCPHSPAYLPSFISPISLFSSASTSKEAFVFCKASDPRNWPDLQAGSVRGHFLRGLAVRLYLWVIPTEPRKQEDWPWPCGSKSWTVSLGWEGHGSPGWPLLTIATHCFTPNLLRKGSPTSASGPHMALGK